ncbi:MAG: type II toxin-antitoxin system VapC family toxin [Planctomycetes bacterium]|nr:type II toxin-antitoxin system VapC family toxin [Planctomycetota bacterium]
MIVLDASVMVEILLGTDLGRRAGDRVRAAKARHAPHLLDAEVGQVLRRFVSSKQIAAERAHAAIADLSIFPVRRHAHSSLLERAFELRSSLTVYDALYLALAESLEATLVTADAALARVPHRRAEVELVK